MNQLTTQGNIARDYDELEAELQRPVLTWKPHKDASHPTTLIGRVEDRYLKTSDYFDASGQATQYPVLVIDDERTETVWVVYGSSGQLRGKIARNDPRIGDRVGVAYAGRADENDEKSALRHNLKVLERASAEETPVEEPTEEPSAGGGQFDDGIPFMPTVNGCF